MSNSFHHPVLLVKLFGVCLIVGTFGSFMPTEESLTEALPSVEAILDEAIELVAPSARVGGDERVSGTIVHATH